MGELLCKYKGLAPWVGMAGALIINVLAVAYWSGVMSQRMSEHDRRIAVIEASDKEQVKWLERIASMESDLKHVLVELKAQRGSGK